MLSLCVWTLSGVLGDGVHALAARAFDGEVAAECVAYGKQFAASATVLPAQHVSPCIAGGEPVGLPSSRERGGPCLQWVITVRGGGCCCIRRSLVLLMGDYQRCAARARLDLFALFHR